MTPRVVVAALVAAGCGGSIDSGGGGREDCDPDYEGACLDPNAIDYDCEGGSGDGPEYTGQYGVSATIRVRAAHERPRGCRGRFECPHGRRRRIVHAGGAAMPATLTAPRVAVPSIE